MHCWKLTLPSASPLRTPPRCVLCLRERALYSRVRLCTYRSTPSWPKRARKRSCRSCSVPFSSTRCASHLCVPSFVDRTCSSHRPSRAAVSAAAVAFSDKKQMSGSLSSGSSSPSPLSSSASSSSPSSSPWASEHDHLKPLHPWYRLASRQPFVLAERSFLAQGQDEHRELVGGTEQTDLHFWFEARRSWERHRYGQVCVGREFQVDAERIPPPDAPHSGECGAQPCMPAADASQRCRSVRGPAVAAVARVRPRCR